MYACMHVLARVATDLVIPWYLLRGFGLSARLALDAARGILFLRPTVIYSVMRPLSVAG
jgi:hypothetical protein